MQASLEEFAREVEERARTVELPVVEGELRDSHGYTWTLQGTFAARARQKRRNAYVERLLVRDAEPWSALAARRGGASRRHLVQTAWQTLLQCHPHDTLCGCSIDEVARAMDARLEDAGAQARGIRFDALLDLVGHDAVRARTRPEAWAPALIVRNPSARPRAGIAEVEILVPVRHVPVGPGSGMSSSADAGGSEPSADGKSRDVALDGGRIPIQILARKLIDRRVESPRHYPRNELVERIRALAMVPEVAGYGTTAWPIGDGTDLAPRLEHPVVVDGTTIDNGLLRIETDGLGARLVELATGRRVESLIAFEDVADAGDLYTHSPIHVPNPSPKLEGVRCVRDGRLRGTVELRWRVPVAPATPRDPERHRRSRAGPVLLAVRLSLDAGSRVVRIAARGVNGATDHRLRLRIATGVAGGDVWADAAFGPVRRVPLDTSTVDAVMETPPPTAPLHRYVTRTNGTLGTTVFADGLAEYEACDDGAIAITLVRAVGALSRNDLPERPGHAGWPTPTPEAQCLGPFAGGFALLLHGHRDAATIDLVERTADDVLLPLSGATIRSALELPDPTRGIELLGEGLAFSTAKESEDGESLVLRCVNLLDREVEGAWRLGFPVQAARLARLDETPLDSLTVRGEEIRFRVGPRAAVTILV
jgi:hypothetical protein